MKAFPISKPNCEIASFYSHIGDIIDTSLNNYEKSNVHNIVVLLKTICDEKSDYLDRYLPSLVKMIQVCSFKVHSDRE